MAGLGHLPEQARLRTGIPECRPASLSNDDVLRDMHGNVICGDDTDPEILGLGTTQASMLAGLADLSIV